MATSPNIRTTLALFAKPAEALSAIDRLHELFHAAHKKNSQTQLFFSSGPSSYDVVAVTDGSKVQLSEAAWFQSQIAGAVKL